MRHTLRPKPLRQGKKDSSFLMSQNLRQVVNLQANYLRMECDIRPRNFVKRKKSIISKMMSMTDFLVYHKETKQNLLLHLSIDDLNLQ